MYVISFTESDDQGQCTVFRSAEVSGNSEETSVPEKEAQQQQQQPPKQQQQLRDETDSSFHAPDFNRQNTQVLHHNVVFILKTVDDSNRGEQVDILRLNLLFIYNIGFFLQKGLFSREL